MEQAGQKKKRQPEFHFEGLYNTASTSKLDDIKDQ
jgi:hypothetical protein